MYDFTYHRPRTREEAAELLAVDEEARVLAGGMSLLPAMKLHLSRPAALVDLAHVEGLDRIAVEHGTVTIGAMTRHADVARSPAIRAAIPSLSALAAGIGDRQVRNRGTIGGSVANSDPAACYPAAVLGLGATVRTNRRAIAADDFFLGLFETALQPGEFIVEIAFPRPRRSAYEKFRQQASRFALVGVFVSQSVDGDVRVAVTGAGPCVFRVEALERALAEELSAASAQSVRIDPDGLNSDLHGDAEYRAAMIPVITGRAVSRAASPAGEDAR
jgi:carbon-monoxide dehydrogenase medium subunit